MKKLILLLLVGILTATLAAQTVERHPSYPVFRNTLERTDHFSDHQPGHRHLMIKPPGLNEPSETMLTSPLELKQKLDSLVFYIKVDGQWVGLSKDEYGYNSNGKITLLIEYNHQSNSLKDQNQWINARKHEYSYDNNHTLSQSIMYTWDDDAGNWVRTYKSEYSHDNDGNLIQVMNYSWDENTSQWVDSWKTDLTYDANGNLTLATGSEYDEDSGQWVYFFKAEYSYDNDGNLIMETDYGWNEDQWIEDYKCEYAYDGDGHLISDTEYYWDGHWIKDSKYEYTYDNNGNMILEEDYYWEGQWKRDGKYEYVFDDNGNLTEELAYNWDENTNSWEELFKDDHTYDNSYSFDELVLPIIYDEDYIFYSMDSWWRLYYHHMLLTSVRFYPEEGFREWYEKYKNTYYYSEINIVGIAEGNDNTMTIYPNPAGDEFTVQSLLFKVSRTFVELYDLNGRKLLEKNIPRGSQEVTVDVSSLQSGFYFCRIRTENGSVTKKLIIRK